MCVTMRNGYLQGAVHSKTKQAQHAGRAQSSCLLSGGGTLMHMVVLKHPWFNHKGRVVQFVHVMSYQVVSAVQVLLDGQ